MSSPNTRTPAGGKQDGTQTGQQRETSGEFRPPTVTPQTNPPPLHRVGLALHAKGRATQDLLRPPPQTFTSTYESFPRLPDSPPSEDGRSSTDGGTSDAMEALKRVLEEDDARRTSLGKSSPGDGQAKKANTPGSPGLLTRLPALPGIRGLWNRRTPSADSSSSSSAPSSRGGK